jgi:hypothetical protein
MIRSDRLGITSIIRDISLPSKHYKTMLHFVHSSVWTLPRLKWFQVVRSTAPLYHVNGAVALVGDKITDEQERFNILLTIKAIERYVMFACTAIGML